MSAESPSSPYKILDENQTAAGNSIPSVTDWGVAVDHHNYSSAKHLENTLQDQYAESNYPGEGVIPVVSETGGAQPYQRRTSFIN